MAECANPRCKGGASAGWLCKKCVTDLRQQLLTLPTFLGFLSDTALGQTRMSDDTTRSSAFGSRTPTLDYRASHLIDDVGDTLGGWARGTARLHGIMISPPVSYRGRWDVYVYTSADYAMFLAAHVNQLAKDPDVGELCDQLRHYIRRGLGIINRRTPPQFCGPCPATVTDHHNCVPLAEGGMCAKQPHECDTRLLARRGAPEVTCGFCGAVHDVGRLVNHLLARADHFRATIPELYRVLRMLDEPIPIRTLYRWAEPKSTNRGSGQLRPSGYLREDKKTIGITRREHSKDQPLYRVSDARKLRKLKADNKTRETNS
jgi:hypothetical protein